MKLIHGDCLEKMKNIDNNSIDAIITDPPYGLSFMGKKWDYDVPSVEIWQECLRVLKPGGYILAFAGTRTQHKMACNIEDAGFEIRDMIAWVYGSGFPKSHNIGKAVDKLQGNEREDLGKLESARETVGNINICKKNGSGRLTKGTSPYEGWGTALKPALEPITVARKPLSEKTVAENVLKWGTGGINIDECRVGTEKMSNHGGGINGDGRKYGNGHGIPTLEKGTSVATGRFPANLIHDGSDEVVECFPNDSQRFFYCAKASKKERNAGCDGLEEQTVNDGRDKDIDNAFQGGITPRKNTHPTVKPIALMEYLVKLVSKEEATVLDPFLGSGTTGIACKQLNRNFIGIERDAEYIKIAEARIGKAIPNNINHSRPSSERSLFE